MPAFSASRAERNSSLLPVDSAGARHSRVDPGDDLHQRAFTGPVLADETMDLAGVKGEIDIPEGGDPAEGF